jgi:hypothetical protein
VVNVSDAATVYFDRTTAGKARGQREQVAVGNGVEDPVSRRGAS